MSAWFRNGARVCISCMSFAVGAGRVAIGGSSCCMGYPRSWGGPCINMDDGWEIGGRTVLCCSGRSMGGSLFSIIMSTAFEFLREWGCEGMSGDIEGSMSPDGSPLSISISRSLSLPSSDLRFFVPRRLWLGV